MHFLLAVVAAGRRNQRRVASSKEPLSAVFSSWNPALLRRSPPALITVPVSYVLPIGQPERVVNLPGDCRPISREIRHFVISETLSGPRSIVSRPGKADPRIRPAFISRAKQINLPRDTAE